MSRQLYFECASGISGDMTVAALLDLGADEKTLRETLGTLPIEEPYEIHISRVKKSSLDVCDFLVKLPQDGEFLDHDMEYLHGHLHEHDHEHESEAAHDHGHDHDHDHDHDHSHDRHDHDYGHTHSHGHEHDHSHTHAHAHGRGPDEIRGIFAASSMTDGAKAIANRILQVLAEAEAAVHGTDVSLVHFHEAGAVDSIIDIAATAICLDNLAVDGVIFTELCEGHGSVRCQHGLLPIPVPAVTKIATAHGLKFRFLPVEGELVTPTGAAIAAATITSDTLPAAMKILGCGMGAGKRSYDVPEILRVFLVETPEEDGAENFRKKDVIWKLETNVDDCTGETLGYVMEQLFAAGARDVNYTPVFMKKNRPAYELHVICDAKDVPRMEEIIFRETTTVGIRRMPMERTVLSREVRRIETSLGEAVVKVCPVGDEEKIYPEYESAAKIARARHLPLQKVYDTVKKESEER